MLSFLLFALQAQAVSCQDRYVDWQNPRSVCREWATTASPFLESFSENGIHYDVPNPSFIDRGVATGPVARLTLKANVNETQFAAMSEQFQSLKRTMISQVTRDLPSASLNGQQRYLRERIESAHLKVLPESHETCQSPTQFNARYEARANQVSVCPLTTHLPVQAWLPLVAHELGHLADPCTYTQSFAFTAQMPETRGAIAVSVEKCVGPLPKVINRVADMNRERAVALDSTFNLESAERLKKCGLLAETRDPVPPNGYTEHPYLAELERADGAKLSGPRTEAQCTSVQENEADQIGFALLSAHLHKHPVLFSSHAALVSYFYGTTNCATVEHRAGDGTYAPSRERIANFLSLPEVRALAKCDGAVRMEER